nr:3'-5' exonuclease [Deinococcus cavernae]
MHTSFRTHAALVEAVNAFFGSLMRGPDELRPTATPFEPLIADRAEAPSDEPGVEVHVLQGDQGLREAEAAYLAQRIQALLLGGHTVFDRETGQLRPVRLGDIAFLFRARTDLKVYEEFLTLAGIPYQVLGGDGLLQRQEVQDALHLLLVLDNPHRDVSLAAVLRSPIVHLTDQDLLEVAGLRGAGESLWQAAGRSAHPTVQAACALIHDLRERSATASMGQLLTEVDGRTGLFAIHAAQPDGGRRVANLRQFQALLRIWALEGQRDLASVALRLQQMLRLQAQAAEGSSASEHAVKLMTIHGSKGLEFPVVIYADALRQGGGFPPVVRFDPGKGVALRLPRMEGDLPEWDALEATSKERELSEDERLAYVAFTRAADLLVLSVTAKDSGAGLERANAFLHHLPEEGVTRTYLAPEQVTPPEALGMTFNVPRPILPVRSGPGAVLPSTLPVTSVATYLTCPRRFAYRHVEGRLPLAALWSELEELVRLNPEGRVAGRQIGDAVHQAMEHGWRGEELLSKVTYLALPDQQQVVTLVQAFSKPVFASVNTRTYQCEKPIQVPLGGILFEGVVDAFDAVGGLVLDYKTDRTISPEHHLPQLSLYARHLGASEAVLAYLRHDHLHQFSTQDLQEGFEWVREAVDRMNQRQFEPAPEVHKCRRCEFRGVCDAAVNDAVVSA